MRLSTCSGLSPRLRGSGVELGGGQLLDRVIPAPAGIGDSTTGPPSCGPGYPRACGDRWAEGSVELTAGGLSPRLRGSDGLVGHGLRPRRVIPAPAGIGRVVQFDGRPSPGYPRACGDRSNIVLRSAVKSGLSPRLRGSEPTMTLGEILDRVIPAPAGIGRLSAAIAVAMTGYPRACGDRTSSHSSSSPTCGLSPRLRGSGGGARQPVGAGRVIPAPAGIGPPRSTAPTSMPGYPRACGDRYGRPPELGTVTGLSPRLRGSVGRRRCRQL